MDAYISIDRDNSKDREIEIGRKVGRLVDR